MFDLRGVKLFLVFLSIFIFILFCGCVFPDHGYYIFKLDEPVEDYFNMSYDNLYHFPILKRAILNDIIEESISISTPEFDWFRGVTNFYDTNCFLYNGSYYEIGFYFAD